jgi:UDP-N-acetylglucosamine--N-acetylmuramyl-(pentapeptide) pyrophosphoryl-undecaprenol N-acetylglucosamine transferase
MSLRSVIISGGGTGGHIFPALSIADEIKRRYPECEVLFVGAKGKMEMERVPQAGYPIEGLWISGIQRHQKWKNISFPFKLISSLWKARSIVKKVKPQVAIGTGGFASGPLLQMAGRAGIPTILQEQNSYPGITNKLLSKAASAICVAYDGLERFFPAEKIVNTGNPVRSVFAEKTMNTGDARFKMGLKKDMFTVLVLGGSLGAREINRAIFDHLRFFEHEKVQVLWQCGRLYEAEYKPKVNHPDIKLVSFISDMAAAYASADIIVSRAGAGTISELCLIGKPAILIPSPNVAEDHQTKNAQYISDNDAAVLLPESDLSDRFSEVLFELISNDSKRMNLGSQIAKLAKPNATSEIVDIIEKYA